MTDPKRYVGRVIKISPTGWGFIISKEIPFTRIFFHWTALIPETIKFPELKKGDEVEFSVLEVPERGTRAIKIDVLEPDTMHEIKQEVEGNK